MNIFQAVILGLVQGLTEFLPISSSGHLILVPYILHWPDPGLGFDVALHWGTLVAVIAYFWRDYLRYFSAFFSTFIQIGRGMNLDQKMSWYLVAGSVPAAITGVLLEKQAESAFRSPVLIAATMAIFGLILWVADSYGSKKGGEHDLSFSKALLIGCAQALALIPGVSRSGSTMTAGLFAGLNRESAARFSFLLLGPISFGAGLVAFKNFTGISTPLVAGFAAAVVSGLWAISFLLDYLSRKSFRVFVWYRLLASALVLALLILR